MGSEWKEVLVGEYAKLQGGYAFKSKDFIEQGFPVVKIKNVKHREIDLADVGYVNENIAIKAKDYYIKNGSILICMTGSGIHAPNSIVGRVARHQGEDDAFLINQRVGRFIITEPKSLNEGFLYYFLSPKEMQWKLVSIASGSANQVNISGKQIENIEIPLPPLSEQKAIAHILGSLDDKIELNRKMNTTLEEMAQVLFKSWFVDFDPVIDNAIVAGNDIPEELAERAEVRRKALADGTANREAAKGFPAAFQFTEEMGWIPKGWEASPLDILINLIGGGTPKTSVKDYWGGDIPWFSVVDAPNDSDVFVINTDKKITKLGVEKSSTKVLRRGSTIISARGTVGKCALVGTEMAMNQSCYGIQGADGITDIFTYYTIREFVSDLQQRGHGSVFNTITRDTFKSIYVPFCNKELTKLFDNTVKSFLERIRSNLFQNEKLTKLRDTLLPKLISGELRIPEAEEMVEEALA